MKVYNLKKEGTKERKFKIDYKNELNEQQLDVVMNGDGASLVLAGPGSGKTRVLVYRVAYLLEKGVKPEEILLLTFTNKAAKNMLNRVELLLGYSPKGLNGGTFHHVGGTILRKHAPTLGYGRNFSIIDNEDSRQIIKGIIAEMMPSKEQHFPKAGVIFSMISYSRNTGIPLKQCIEEKYSFDKKLTPTITSIANAYEENKKKSNLMDFDDLLIQWNNLLEIEAIRRFYSKKFKYMLVDEFQDTNPIQFQIIKKLSGEESHIMAVGDDCQSIYAFRGAEIKNILEFPKHYKNAKEFKLETNYRSTPEILNLINKSISNNKGQFKKNLKAVNKSKGKPAVVHCMDSEQEAEFICQRILELKEEGESYNGIGILFRADYQSAQLELELMKKGIPYRKRGGLRFFEQAHIKDLTSFLKIFSNSQDELAWKRSLCLFEGIGDSNVQKIWNELSKHDSPIDFIKSKESITLASAKAARGWAEFRKIILGMKSEFGSPSEIAEAFFSSFYESYIKDNFPNFRDRILDIKQYINLADQYTSIERFLEDVLLDADLTGSESVSNKQEDEAVILSTIHQSKGLEWNSVFIISLAENRFPLERASRDDSIEEERRLFYVACSRAKNELYLCIPMEESTYWRGESILKDSRFIEELPSSVYEEWKIRGDFSNDKNDGEDSFSDARSFFKTANEF